MKISKSGVVDFSLTLASFPLVLIPVVLALSYGVWVGPIVFLTGFVPWPVARARGVGMRKLIPDITFGIIDTGFMTLAAILGGVYMGGVLGAAVGAGVGDGITDAIGGHFEGAVASKLRSMGVNEARTPISCAMGKLSGCLLGAGATISIAQLVGVLVAH